MFVFWAQLLKLITTSKIPGYLRCTPWVGSYDTGGKWDLQRVAETPGSQQKIPVDTGCFMLRQPDQSQWKTLLYRHYYNIILHLQENTFKICFLFVLFPLLFLCLCFPPLLMCFMLSKMHLVIFQKCFKFFTCPVHFPFCLLNYFKLVCSPPLMGQLWFQTERTITTLFLQKYNALWLSD